MTTNDTLDLVEIKPQTTSPSLLTQVAIGTPVIIAASLAATGIPYGVVALWNWYNSDEIEAEQKKAIEAAKLAEKKRQKALAKARKVELAEFSAEINKGFRSAFAEQNQNTSVMVAQLSSLNTNMTQLVSVLSTVTAEKPKKVTKPRKATAKKAVAA